MSVQVIVDYGYVVGVNAGYAFPFVREITDSKQGFRRASSGPDDDRLLKSDLEIGKRGYYCRR